MSSVAMLTACATKVEDPQPMPRVEHVVEKKARELVWEDNFDSLSTKRWNLLDEGWGDHGRLHHYKPSNVSVEDGKLSIKVKEEKYKGFDYTSGAITTQGKAPIKYGKIEVRAKFPSGAGLLPAIWMLPDNGDPLPEIDIVEMVTKEPNLGWSVTHFMEGSNQTKDGVKEPFRGNMIDEYHVYSVEWTKEGVTYAVDGKPTLVSDYSPDVPMYLYINTAVGGNWAGKPVNPKDMEDYKIDYVRVYK